MELTGKIIAILPVRSGVSSKSGNPWMTQQYVLEIPGQYPKRMAFEVFGEDRIRQFNIQMGCQYKVSFDIDASEYQGKWYNSIKAYSVVALTQSAAVQAASPAAHPVQHAAVSPQHQPAQPPLFPPEQLQQDNSDDLPF